MDDDSSFRICNNCKRSIKSTTFELHESHCIRHIKLCHICNEPVPLKDMDGHFQDNHAPVPCSLCGFHVPPDQLEEHQEQSCTEAKVECKYCELDIRRGSYPEHVEQCGSRTDYCELCNQRVMLKEMNEHKAMKCGHMKSESPLNDSDLRGMGLVDESDESGSDEGHSFWTEHHSTGPPPPYEHSHDDSMQVDPYWLQTVAEACGEDNLDALLAQNVFFENVRSTRSGISSIHTRDGPTLSHQVPPVDMDNRLLDEVEEREQTRVSASYEDKDFNLAQRMQEKEVLGHSRTLYEEQRARDVASAVDEERRLEESNTASQSHEERADKKHSSSAKLVQEEEEEEGSEVLNRRLRETREEANKLAKRIEELDQERKSLTLALELQKEEESDSHQALWRTSSHTTTSAAVCGGVLDSHLDSDDEQPRPKTPPPSSDSVPCQWCNKLIPFEQVMLHQQSCYDDYYKESGSSVSKGGGSYRRGPHFTDDRFRRVEQDEEQWHVDEFDVECQYCHTSVTISNLATHEALCDSNPDINLKRVYESRCSSSNALPNKMESTTPPMWSSSIDVAATTKLLTVEKGPCEYCHKVIPLSELIKHEATCAFSRPKYSPAPGPPPSSPTLFHEKTVADGNGGVAATNKRGLAIKFPAKDKQDGTLAPTSGLHSDQLSTVTSPGAQRLNTKSKMMTHDKTHPLTGLKSAVTRHGDTSTRTQPGTKPTRHGDTSTRTQPGTKPTRHGDTSTRTQPGTKPTRHGDTSTRTQPGTKPTRHGDTSTRTQPGTKPTRHGDTSTRTQPGTKPTRHGDTSTRTQPGTKPTRHGDTRTSTQPELR